MPFSITSNLPIATLAMLVIGLGIGYLVLRIAFFYRVGIHEDKAPDRSLLSSSLALALSRRKIDSSARRKHVVCLAFCLLFYGY
ncbi:hypothetical protein L1889_10410 [Paenalcaligenes niemegkensis]|uniref:hypothetical protein n=1 Tax=Paenalcaligenes niemegkensis TaxID=2895469 RepID=UPI001EE82187|nr:hypothetical protein [Paenalcaligenes niemegkensis]MCQ9617065.1 hypothetical protein [Paenalcaligenes niemegkensis]